jgi:hypothetical protein
MDLTDNRSVSSPRPSGERVARSDGRGEFLNVAEEVQTLHF